MHMKSPKDVRVEHEKACANLDALMQKGLTTGANGPLPEDMNLYRTLSTIRETLEWVCSGLIETTAKPMRRELS